ncbi:MAG: hypothetical protein J5671_01130 [Bacteroidaceae bacterium]|nr:hypothetical protein [Bacteroidaceae bacterium]
MIIEPRLYYDTVSKVFSIDSTHNSVELFKAHYRENLKCGRNEFIQDQYRVIIQTNFYPKALQRQYIYVNIYINDILILPLSLAYRPNVRWWCYNLIENIYFSEYKTHSGNVSIYPKEPSTIVKQGDNINWEEILLIVCEICNNYKEWISNEVSSFVDKVEKLSHLDWRICSMAISMIRIYDELVPEIIPMYQPLLDCKVLDAMNAFWKYVKQDKASNTEMKQLMEKGEVIWHYIQNYKLKN